MSRTAVPLLVLGLSVTAAAPHATPSEGPPFAGKKDDRGRSPEGKPRPRFTVGKETTYALGPRRDDGRIDYAAALNERLRGGVTPATNAKVLILKALGPRPEGAELAPGFYRWLGIEAPPERGDYFRPVFHYLRDRLGVVQQADLDAVYDALDRPEQPWTAKRHPLLADWLKANEKPLNLVVRASRRPDYFMPLVAKGKGRLIEALVSSVQRCREVALALSARAMLRAGEGKADAAWQDLLACHRLGRQVARGGTLIEGLVGLAIDNIASGADVAFLGRARLTPQQVKDCLRDLRRLPPMPRMAAKADLTERFIFLDIVMAAERDGIQSLAALVGGPLLQSAPDARARRTQEDIDWDVVLRTTNRYFDRLAAAMRVNDRLARDKQLDRLEQELRERKQSLMEAGGLGKALLAAPDAQARGRLLADALRVLLTPSVRKVQQASDRIGQVHQNVQLAFALAAYRAEHGRYPKALEALAPKYLPRIPNDVFSGKALIYRPVESAFLLYSVGVNGRDEQGRSYDDDPPGDDLRVRMPLPELRRK
jgi:hypothetical protein